MSRFEALPTTDKNFLVSIETIRSRYTPSVFWRSGTAFIGLSLNLARILGVPRDKGSTNHCPDISVNCK